MKKVLLSLGLLAGFAGAANAQTGIKYGVKGGFNLSSYTGGGDIGSSTGYKPGFAAGVLVNFGLSDATSVQIEGLYSQKGTFIDQANYTGSPLNQYNGQQYRSTLSYIDVPVLFKVNTGDDGKGLFFELGPQASFAVGSREFFRPQGWQRPGSGRIHGPRPHGAGWYWLCRWHRLPAHQRPGPWCALHRRLLERIQRRLWLGQRAPAWRQQLPQRCIPVPGTLPVWRQELS
jgi:hypothetical protein